MKYPKPTPSQQRDGWEIEVGFLKRVQEVVERRTEGNDFLLEDIEDILVSLAEVEEQPLKGG